MTQFIAATGIKNPHLQTLLPRLIRRKVLFDPVWQTLDTWDGDFLDLAWSEDYTTEVAQTKPLFILFHGLEGGFDSPYANGLMHAFHQQGWLAVIMHFRGCSGKPNRLARSYHSGEIEDARFLLEYLNQKFPHQQKLAAGISLGGNMLVNYLAHFNDNPLLNAATVISAPLDLASCSYRIEKGFSRIYKKYLLSSLKRSVLAKNTLLRDKINLSECRINRITRLEEFDDLITAPLNGFVDAQDYYRQCSGLAKLKQITIPTQIIQAKDDPFMTDAVVPKYILPDVIDYRLFAHGGHVGFLSGSLLHPHFWLEENLPAYYQSMVHAE